MAEGYTVSVVYKNNQLGQLGEKQYSLDSYCDHTKSIVLDVITDIENVFFQMEGANPKKYWSDEHKEQFAQIRHKLLNAANDINRIPMNMCKDGININTMSPSQYVAEKLTGVQPI